MGAAQILQSQAQQTSRAKTSTDTVTPPDYQGTVKHGRVAIYFVGLRQAP